MNRLVISPYCIYTNRTPFLPDFDLVATSMEFDGRFDSEKSEGNFRIIEALLQELDSNSMPMVQSQVPALFTQLVENLRLLNQRQFSQLYDANRGTRVWNFLVDAAPLVATPASTAIVTKLITSGQMTEEEANVWFTSLAFVTNPKAEMFPPLTVSTCILHAVNKLRSLDMMGYRIIKSNTSYLKIFG